MTERVREFGDLEIGETFKYGGQTYRKEREDVARLIELDDGEIVDELILHRFFPEIEVVPLARQKR